MKRLAKLIGAVAVAALVAGCSVVSQAGSAVVVGSARMTNDEVASQYAEVRAALGGLTIDGTAADINRQLLSGFVFDQLVDAALAETGLEVTAGEIAAQRAQLVAQLGSEEALNAAAAQSAIPPSQIDRALKFSLAYQALAKHFLDPAAADQATAQNQAEAAAYELVGEKATELGVEVSPRFGRWDPDTMMILGDGTSDVIVTTEQLAQLAAQ